MQISALLISLLLIQGSQVYATFKRGILECVEKSKVSPQLVLQVTSGNWDVREDYRLKVWALCLLLKAKMMSKDGVFHLDIALTGVPENGKLDPDAEVEKFIQANTQELSKDKWLCPLSGKKFKGPDFIRKHIFNKHAEKVDEVRREVAYFNAYVRDVRRPQQPEPPARAQPACNDVIKKIIKNKYNFNAEKSCQY
ncbi:Serrate RNA effector molecule-like [Papilio machaon]|uniref:Serrate RNA effector molecule-like n=1 Tax=Papilio machaon TaxID=76193 RepID=A0A194RK71_PAPMA|nr:Serrate RNA effector molecule-like [Papilio machaon]